MLSFSIPFVYFRHIYTIHSVKYIEVRQKETDMSPDKAVTPDMFNSSRKTSENMSIIKIFTLLITLITQYANNNENKKKHLNIKAKSLYKL